MSDGLHKVFDASKAPLAPPAPGCEGVLMYVGRAGFTPHVWTIPEADRFANLRQFPAWLPDFGNDPVTEARAAIAAVQGMGWAAHEKFPRAIVYDFETSVFRDWYAVCAGVTIEAGFSPVIYGSLSTVLGNAAADNWIAAWDGVPALLPGQTIHGDQYANDGTYDLSVVDGWLFDRGGIGARHA